jgi:hypothetical protein
LQRFFGNKFCLPVWSTLSLIREMIRAHTELRVDVVRRLESRAARVLSAFLGSPGAAGHKRS